MKFTVTIKRTIRTVVEVEAASAVEARRAIKAYGVTEAISDYPTIDEMVNVRIMSVDAA